MSTEQPPGPYGPQGDGETASRARLAEHLADAAAARFRAERDAAPAPPKTKTSE